MTRDTTTELLIHLIQRVPVLTIDMKAAEARGNFPALAYKHVITAWLREAAEALAEIQEGSPPQGDRNSPDADARAAAAFEMMRITLEPASA
jgi:hypothetical protein